MSKREDPHLDTESHALNAPDSILAAEPKKLRIAILALSARSYGGVAYFEGLLPALVEQSRDFEFLVFAEEDAFARFCRRKNDPRLQRYPVPRGLHGARRILWEQCILPTLLQSLEIDLIYTATNVGIILSGIPCVISVRNMDPLLKVTKRRPGYKLRNFILRHTTLLSARRARRVVAVSHFVRSTLEARGIHPSKIDVIYHGIDDQEAAEAAAPSSGESGAGFIFSAAKFVRYANLKTLFRSYARMRELGYRGSFRFAGGPYDPAYEKEVKSLVRSLGLEEFVEFLGYIPREDIQRNLRLCDVFLFPSALEACPFTLLEAMRQGAVIVTTTAEPMREFCLDAARYVEPEDFEGMAVEAWRLISELELRGSLRRKGLARARSFRWDENVAGLLRSFERAAADARQEIRFSSSVAMKGSSSAGGCEL